jgi:hypothetical protein
MYNNYKESLVIESNTTSSFTSNNNLDLYINNYNSDDDLYISNNNTTTNNIENKIDIYLVEPRVAKDITIENYYNTNKTRFPIIYNIARDYLAISTTSTPSEATFSKVGNIVTKSRNRLLSNTIKKLIILKELNAIDEEELINNNILFIGDNNNNNIEEAIIEEDNLEDKSTTSITSYNSDNTANNSTNSNNS